MRLSWAEIDAWARLKGLRLDAFELSCLDEIEGAFFRVAAAAQKQTQDDKRT